MKTINTLNINDIVAGCKLGNRQMQEMLYKQSAAKMFAICMRYAKDRMEAEDVLQMGYIKVFGKLNEFKGEGSFEGWMRKIMVNTAIESYRKNLRSLTFVQIDDVYDQPQVGFDYDSLGVKDLMKLIQNLADGYRVVFNMYTIEGYSHKEIAKELGISEGASKSQLSRARAILQKEIIKMEDVGHEKYVG